jgi:hypothetical protein
MRTAAADADSKRLAMVSNSTLVNVATAELLNTAPSSEPGLAFADQFVGISQSPVPPIHVLLIGIDIPPGTR